MSATLECRLEKPLTPVPQSNMKQKAAIANGNKHIRIVNVKFAHAVEKIRITPKNRMQTIRNVYEAVHWATGRLHLGR